VSSYTPRLLEPPCRAALDARKILVLIGARQTGKSTLASALLADVAEEQKLLLNLDDPFLRDRLVAEEGALMAAIERKAGRPWGAVERFHLVVDEAQRAPALFPILKALHDRERQRLSLIVTGSSALGIHDPVAESFAGRARILVLHPFTLSEGFAHSRGGEGDGGPLAPLLARLLEGSFSVEDFTAIVERSRWSADARRAYARAHLRHPLFPEPSASDRPELWVRDYLSTYIEKDVQSLASVGNVTLFRACLRQVAARTGSPFKWEPAAQEVGTTSVTLRKYAGLMEQTYNLQRVEAFAANPVARIIKAPKLYLSDPGLLWGLRGFEDLRLLEASGMLGAYMELAVVGEIAKWCSLEPTAPELRFWSKTAVSEVDLVVSNRGFHIPFEIKLGERFQPRWLRGLDAFEGDHAGLGLAIPYRVIVHCGEPAQIDARTFLLPLWCLT
jgi:predicted AAA+ superfamily ATPase